MYNVRVDFSPSDQELFEAVEPFTQTSPERIFSLARAVEYIESYGIEGAIVECGVWRGGSMMAIAKTLLRLDSVERDLLLFDTFEGMPAATVHDVDHEGVTADEYLRQSPTLNAVGLDEVRKNMESTGYPSKKVHYIKGLIEDTVPGEAPDRIALLRLDTDWYESTRHELVHLFPKLVPNGVLVIDDYGHFQGAQKAVDEYFASQDQPIYLGRIDYTARVVIKPAPQ